MAGARAHAGSRRAARALSSSAFANTRSSGHFAARHPAVVGALAQKVQSPQGANDLLSTLQRAGFDGSKAFTSLSSQLTAQLGSSGGLSDLTKWGGGLVERTLTCGSRISASANGVESNLIGFLDDRTRPVGNTMWFTFDRLQFETASATLKPESQAQVRNVAEILKCYPTAAVKVGGYTDNVGNPASNMTLSRSRAEVTVRAIAAEGIHASRLEAEGYGEQHPVASNDTEDGRQRNRRIDVRVTRK